MTEIGIDWIGLVTTKLIERNRKQTKPFQQIYHAHMKLWTENQQLQRQHVLMNQQVVILQHEIQEDISRGDQSPAVERLKSRIHLLQEQMKDVRMSSTDDVRQRLELHQKNEDLSKQNFDLQDELRVTKFELESSRESIRTLEMHIDNLNGSINKIKEEVDSLRKITDDAEKKSRKLEVENAELVNRIMTEKMRNAQEMNDMTQSLLNRPQNLVSGGISFIQSLGAGRQRSKTVTAVDSNSKPKHNGNSNSNGNVNTAPSPNSHSKPSPSSPTSNSTSTIEKDTYVTDDFNEAIDTSISLHSIEGVRTPHEPRQIISCHNTEINDIIYTKHHFVTAGADSVIKVYDFQTQQLLHNLITGGPVYSVDIIDDLIVGSCSDKSCRVWNLTSGRLLQTLTSHLNKVYAVKFI
eukprot:gene9391-19486_t